MDGAFQAIKVTDDVYWVGAIDWNMRNFHGYLTGRGTTYNAFLILGDAVTLIDTVKAPYYDEMMARIASLIDPKDIRYIVSNHSEMDHSGSLTRATAAVEPEKVFASKMGQRALVNHFHIDPESITVVGDGDSIDLGGMKLSFVETRMCHWPDSMVSYLQERQLLFSQDAFGMHLAGYERFADEYSREVLDYEAAKYYANILLHLSPFIEKTLAKMASLNLPLAMVAPDHGPIWRTSEDIQRILGDYARWAKQEPTKKAVVIFDTMWGSTDTMAQAVGEGLSSGGMKVKLMNLSSAHRSDVVTELLEAGALLVGSPTMNNQIFPAIADTMTYLKGLQPRHLVGAAFGSYGWSGEAPKQLQTMLEDMGVSMAAEPLRVNYVPDEAGLVQCRELGLCVANAVDTMVQGKPVTKDGELPAPTPPAGPETCTVDVNHGAKTLTVPAGKTLFEALNEADIHLPTICGGQGMCGLCKLTVLSGADGPTTAERGHLTETQIKAGLRLGCQVKVHRNLAVVVPEEVLSARPFEAKLESVRDLTHDIKLFRFELVEPRRIEFTPGAYLKLHLPTSVDPSGSSRAFSLASPPADQGHIELIIKRFPGGLCTGWLFHKLQVGQSVHFDGPYGQFGLTDGDAEMIWVAGGSGLSAFWSILRHLAGMKTYSRKCTLYFGAVARRDLYLLDELRDYETKLNWFKFIPALSQPSDGDAWEGEAGLITEVLERHLKEGSPVEAYLCGSPGMIDAAIGVLHSKGLSEERIFFDKFEHQ